METLILWGMGLFALSLLLFAIELILPTGGILGLTAFISAIGGVVAFWFHDTTLGVSALIAVMVLTPVSFHFALRIMPNTPIGRMLILGDEEKDVEQFEALRTQAMHSMDALIGQDGRAMSDLRPVGSVEIGGEVYDALADAGVIEAGESVRVTGISGSEVRVRRL